MFDGLEIGGSGVLSETRFFPWSHPVGSDVGSTFTWPWIETRPCFPLRSFRNSSPKETEAEHGDAQQPGPPPRYPHHQQACRKSAAAGSIRAPRLLNRTSTSYRLLGPAKPPDNGCAGRPCHNSRPESSCRVPGVDRRPSDRKSRGLPVPEQRGCQVPPG